MMILNTRPPSQGAGLEIPHHAMGCQVARTASRDGVSRATTASLTEGLRTYVQRSGDAKVKRSTVTSSCGALHPDASASLAADAAAAAATAPLATASLPDEAAPDQTSPAEVPFGLHPAEIAQAASAQTPRLHPAVGTRRRRRRGA